jgi:hypothetical protein
MTVRVLECDTAPGLIDREHTKKKVVHRINHDLLNQVEIGEMGELHVTGCIVLDEILVCSRCGEFIVFFTELMLLFIHPRVEYCKE